MLTSSLMDHEGVDGDNDESYAVDILINTLQREGAAQSSDTEQGPGKVRNGKGRVSFEAKKQSPHQTFPMENKSVRTSLVIPNLPVNKAHQTLLDTLAELACSKSPVKARSSDNTPMGERKNWRPRAMSEPWLVDDFYSLSNTNSITNINSISNSNSNNSNMNNNSNSNGNGNGGSNLSTHFTPSSIFLSTSSSLSVLVPTPSIVKIEVGEICTSTSTSTTSSTSTGVFPFPSDKHSVPVGIAAWASRKMKIISSASPPMPQSSSSGSGGSGSMMTHSTALPQILEGDYSTVYNKNGRIGIYTREERQSIISRFQDKRRNRVWKKKIRYHCRKNLADRRIRIKGRFVRAVDGSSPSEGSFDTYTPDTDTLEGEGEGEGGRRGINGGTGKRIEVETEVEGDGVTSSEDGEGTCQPMDVTEGEGEGEGEGDMCYDSSSGNMKNSSSSDDLRLVAALVADFSNHSDSNNNNGSNGNSNIGSNSNSSARGFIRGKQQQSGQRVGETQSQGHGNGNGNGNGQGSAVEGMKAFWGAIIESSNPPSLSTSTSVSSTVVPLPPASVSSSLPLTLTGEQPTSTTASSKHIPDSGPGPVLSEEVDDENDEEEDDGGDLWDENGEVRGSQGGQGKKRFRRHTIAY